MMGSQGEADESQPVRPCSFAISERGFGQLGHGTVPEFKAGEARPEDGCKLNPAILNKELSLVSRVVSDFRVWGAWKLFRSK